MSDSDRSFSGGVEVQSGERDMTTTTVRYQVEAAEFPEWVRQRGWDDGLPVVPPTEERVQTFIAASGRSADEVIGVLPPRGSACTVEKIAINAVMAGTVPTAMPLLLSAIEAMADPAFNLSALNATTGTVTGAVIVNGAVRHELDIPSREACFGGRPSGAPSIGRTLRLIMRNVAGQEFGVTSKSVFGQPGLVAGIVVGEWEERSPWAPLAERRGHTGNAITVCSSMGTTNIADHLSDNALTLLRMIGRGMAHVGANGVALAIPGAPYAEAFVAINPIWASMIGKEFPNIEDVQQILWENASIPVSYFPGELVDKTVQHIRYHDGRIHLAQRPEDVIVIVCGGPSSIHAMTMACWGDSRAVTRPVGSCL
jgi:hypothetical protein